ncbi:retrovirus-related pol polyprotein from transposon TNT 1-94 [Tanacetum coccineum]
MLALCHYAQWNSRFMRYVDTKSNENELRHCIEQGPYILTKIVHEEVLATEELPVQPPIHMILNGISDDIYLIVDACSTAREMWDAIKRFQQGESINKQYVKTKLFWEFEKFTFRDGESIESNYSRFYKLMNEMVRNKLKVDNMRISRNTNPLALVVVAQHYPDKYSPDPYYQAPKSHKTQTSSSRHTTTTSSHETTRHKSKEIAKPITPPLETPFKEGSNLKQAQRDKDMQKNLALIAKYIKNIYKPTNNNLRNSSNTRNKTVDNSPRYGNDRQFGRFRNQRTLTVTGARETEVKAYYMYMAKIQEVPTADSGPTYDFEPLEKVETGNSDVILDSSDMCDNEGAADQNTENPKYVRVLLASLIANFKLDLDKNKKSQRQLKKANRSLTQELERSKQDIEKTKQDLALSKQNLIHCKSDLAKLSHLNFNIVNLLSKKDIVNGLPKLKYVKDKLCSSCELGKAKRSTFKTKTVPSSKGRFNDERPEVLKDFVKMIQWNIQAQVITVQTDRGTEFLNKTLHAYFKEEGIEHQTSIDQTPK